VDVSDIKDTTQEISAESGFGEGTMATYIKRNFNQILKPFAEQVDDMQKAINGLAKDMSSMEGKNASHHEMLGEHHDKIASLQKDLSRTTRVAQASQVALEKVTAEKTMLEEEYNKTKRDLKDADERLLAAQASISELQTGLKGTRTSVGKLRDSLSKMEMDKASRIWPTIETISNDLKKLDGAHTTTAQSLVESKTFIDNFHQAFQIFEEAQDHRHVGHDRRFQQVQDDFNKVERSMKDIHGNLQLHSEHLNNIDGTTSPMKVRLDNLEVAREEGRRRAAELEQILGDLKITTSTMGVDVAKLIEFYEEAKSGADIFEVVTSLERKLNINTDNIRKLLGDVDGHSGGHRKAENRTTNLEKAVYRLQDHTQRMSDRIGMPQNDTPTPGGVPGNRSPSPDRPASKDPNRGSYEFPTGAAAGPKMPSAVLKAIDKMSLAARQKRIHETVNDHSDQLARSQTNLQKTAVTLENTEHRVTVLENQMKTAKDDVNTLRASLDLSHEYWRGLSRGIKDMNVDANMDGKVLPPRANLMRLPAISRPQSRQQSSLVAPATAR